MAIQEHDALADRVFAMLAGLPTGHAARPIDANCELASVGFDSLACCELAAVLERDLGLDLVDADVAGARTAGDLVSIVETAAGRQRAPRDRYPRGMGR